MTNINSLNKYKLFFIELDNNIYELLKNLDKSGDVYIVSNANITVTNTSGSVTVTVAANGINDWYNLIVEATYAPFN